MAKLPNRGLGRGFESLIPTDILDDAFDPTAQQDEQVSQLRDLKIVQISPDPEQPRRRFDPELLQDLAESIRLHGVLQPIIVIPKDGSYEIVAGERRWRAAQAAGLTVIPALVRTMTNQHKLELSLIENLQRADLNAIETATAYLKLRDQFNLSLEDIGKRVGNKSAAAISNTLRLLKLPKVAQSAIAEGLLTEGQARPLVGEDEAFVAELVPLIVKEEWSARKVEQYMVNVKAERKQGTVAVGSTDVVVADSGTNELIAKKLAHWQQRLGTENVAIRTNSRGAGQITIKFGSQDELEAIEKLIG